LTTAQQDDTPNKGLCITTNTIQPNLQCVVLNNLKLPSLPTKQHCTEKTARVEPNWPSCMCRPPASDLHCCAHTHGLLGQQRHDCDRHTSRNACAHSLACSKPCLSCCVDARPWASLARTTAPAAAAAGQQPSVSAFLTEPCQTSGYFCNTAGASIQLLPHALTTP